MPEIHQLALKPAIVVVARPPSPEPAIIVGPVMDSAVGSAVAVGASATLPNMAPLAFLAHVSPADARIIAAKIIEAADIVDAAGGGDPMEVGAAIMEAGEMQDSPIVQPLPGVEADALAPEEGARYPDLAEVERRAMSDYLVGRLKQFPTARPGVIAPPRPRSMPTSWRRASTTARRSSARPENGSPARLEPSFGSSAPCQLAGRRSGAPSIGTRRFPPPSGPRISPSFPSASRGLCWTGPRP